MKIKVGKKPTEKKKEPEVDLPVLEIEKLPPCTWDVSMVVYGPLGGKASLVTDPRSWAYQPVNGWVALYTVFGQKFFDCIKEINQIEIIRNSV